MRNQNAYAREVLLAKQSPQALVEAADAVVCICGALSVGDAVEEVAVVGALLPHPLHFSRTWLEISKVLLPQPGLLEDLNLVTWKGGGCMLVRGKRAEDAFGGFARAAVGRGKELEGVVGSQ